MTHLELISIAAFDHLYDLVVIVAPPLAASIGLAVLYLVCFLCVVSPAAIMTLAIIRSGGWRGAAFMAAVWSTAWNIVH